MRLHFDLLGAQFPRHEPLVILHGLFGSSRNWRSIGNSLAEQLSRRIFLMDMRNHGKSPFVNTVSSLDEYASDVTETMREERVDSFNLLGHSMGGLVSMIVALKHPEMVERLVIEDVSTSWSQVKTRINSYFDVMQAVNDKKISDRRLIKEMLLKEEQHGGIVEFLLTNLKAVDGSYKFNLPIKSMREDSARAKLYDWSKFKSVNVPALFLKRERSEYISDKGFSECKKMFPEAQLCTIPGSGHWIHSEKPSDFVSSVCNFLLKGN